MRDPEELKQIMFSDWTREEIVRAAIDESFPEDEETRLRNLEYLIPMLNRRLQEELQSLASVIDSGTSNSFTNEWKAELAVLQDLVTRGIEFGRKHQRWHKDGALCPKCEAPLVGTEQTVCGRCRGTGSRPTT